MSTTNDGSRRPTIYDVAKRAGVSKSLVSLVLRGSPQVSQNRRAAVLSAIKELDYRPSQAATMLASHRTGIIEVVIDDYRNLWFVDLLEGLREELAAEGYRLSVTDIGGTDATDPGEAGWALAAGIDGLVVAREPDDALLRGWQGPTVVAGWRGRPAPSADMVANDDEMGSRLAVGHLLDLGHHRIAHLSGGGGAAWHRERGFAERMQSAGLPVTVVNGAGGTTEVDGYLAATGLLHDHPETTAIYAANDTMALGALAALREHDRSVPGDVSVVGYDDSPLAQSRYLNLTSVDDRSRQVGAVAGRALLARIDNPSQPATQRLIEPALVVRGSSGPRPATP